MPKRAREEDTGPLPVTREVGGEGGSYSDATVQVETKTGNLERIDRPESDQQTPGAVAGAVPSTAEGPDDGVHLRTPSPTRSS